MSEDSQPDPDDERLLFRFVESGMNLSYEFGPIGSITASLGHVIQLCPVLAVRGWATHKEFTPSLRFKHFIDRDHVIGSCLVNQDEVLAWRELLLDMQRVNSCGPRPDSFEYGTRHGLRLRWQAGLIWGTHFLLYVASKQAALLPPDFVSQLLAIFNDFEEFCARYR